MIDSDKLEKLDRDIDELFKNETDKTLLDWLDKRRINRKANYVYLQELNNINPIAQTQASLTKQLAILRPFANKLGLYDAADYIKHSE